MINNNFLRLEKLITGNISDRRKLLEESLKKQTRQFYVEQFGEGTNFILGDLHSSKTLLCAHYDTKLEGFGAYDNCAGVFSLIKLSERKYKNNITFLFTDKEETNRGGSRYFLEQNKHILLKNKTFVYVVDGIGIGNNIIGADYTKIDSSFKTDAHEFIREGISTIHLFTVDDEAKRALQNNETPKHINRVMHSKSDTYKIISEHSLNSFIEKMYNYLNNREVKPWDSLEKIQIV